MKHLKRLGFGLAALCAALSAEPQPAVAADFSGKTIQWWVPFGVGGGTDVWARFFAPQFSEALPGKPTVAIQNVPGGGSITGANQFFTRSRPDGLSILGTSASTQYPAMLGDPRVRYDYADWTPVLATPTGGVVFVNPEYGVTGSADIGKLREQDMRFGSQGATQIEMPVLLAFKMLGLKVTPVFGMKSRGEGRLAFERGEAGIDFQTTSAYLNSVVPLVDAGKAVPLFSLGVIGGDGNIHRDPSFPNLPHFAEFYEAATGAPPSGDAYDAWRALVIAGFSLQKMVVLPKETPADVLDAYRAAARSIIEAPDFRERAGEQIGAYEQLVGDEAESALRKALDLDPKVRDFMINWLAEDYNVRL